MQIFTTLTSLFLALLRPLQGTLCPCQSCYSHTFPGLSRHGDGGWPTPRTEGAQRLPEPPRPPSPLRRAAPELPAGAAPARGQARSPPLGSGVPVGRGGRNPRHHRGDPPRARCGAAPPGAAALTAPPPPLPRRVPPSPRAAGRRQRREGRRDGRPPAEPPLPARGKQPLGHCRDLPGHARPASPCSPSITLPPGPPNILRRAGNNPGSPARVQGSELPSPPVGRGLSLPNSTVKGQADLTGPRRAPMVQADLNFHVPPGADAGEKRRKLEQRYPPSVGCGTRTLCRGTRTLLWDPRCCRVSRVPAGMAQHLRHSPTSEPRRGVTGTPVSGSSNPGTFVSSREPGEEGAARSPTGPPQGWQPLLFSK